MQLKRVICIRQNTVRVVAQKRWQSMHSFGSFELPPAATAI